MNLTENNRRSRLQGWYVPGAFCIGAFLLCTLTQGDFFFWDTVQLAAGHATHFYENPDHRFLLSDELDSGHIPFFGWFLAQVWSLTERSLMVSHWFMLPFLLGIVIQVFAFCRREIEGRWSDWVAVLLLLEPTLLGQSALVSPDVVLIFLFLLSLNGLRTSKDWKVVVGTIFLTLVSMRGFVAAGSLGLIHLWQVYQSGGRNLRDFWRKAIMYIPAVLVMSAYSVYHFRAKGWVFYHEDSSWNESFERVGFYDILYNIGIEGWRILDFGRVGLYIVFGLLILRGWRQFWVDSTLRFWTISSLLVLVPISATILGYKGLIGHRYLLPYFMMAAFTVGSAITVLIKKYQKWLFVALYICLVSGHFWIYPTKISQGWDASLAHRPFPDLIEELVLYLDEEGIPKREVVAFFPILAHGDRLYLDGSTDHFARIDDEGTRYVLYSDVLNGFPDEWSDSLVLSDTQPLWSRKRLGVEVSLYLRPE